MIEIDSEIKKYIHLGGFVGLAQINPIAGNLEYNSKQDRERGSEKFY